MSEYVPHMLVFLGICLLAWALVGAGPLGGE